MNESISANTKAILLLTAPLITGRGKRSSDPLTPREYKLLAKHLIALGVQPADLLAPATEPLLDDCHRVVDKARLKQLLGRGLLLSQAIERWHARAIWVLSRADVGYPKRLKARLGEDAPSILYGCGDRRILDRGGLAVVGSRNVDDSLLEYSQRIGRLAATAGRVLVSGGARGIDQAAMRGALEAGGCAAGVLADSLEKSALQREQRDLLLNEQLVLMSPYDPGVGFHVGQAMQRNKLIYALSDAALVVSAEREQGGTWSGAIEQLEKYRFVPVFVRKSSNESGGLGALAKKGALPWPESLDTHGLDTVFATPAPKCASSPREPQLFWTSIREGADEVREAEVAGSQPSSSFHSSTGHSPLSVADELFMTVRVLLLRLTQEPRRASEVAHRLGVSAPQALKWLNRLTKEGVLEKSKRPVRFSVRPSTLFANEESGSSKSLTKSAGSKK